MTLNFSNIRTLDGSQNDGFEEFCCQLFYFEKKNLNIPDDSQFFRIRGSGGDGGIEAYWQLPNKDEIGIQAKYFLSAKDIDWAQVDKSVKKTLNTHPNIKKYIICFGCDLTDSRKESKNKKKVESQQDKYNKRIKEWIKEAEKKEINIEFEFWGHSKLIEMISRSNPEYEGRRFFWFNEQELSQNFLKGYFEKIREDLGKRYSTKINIKQHQFDYFEYLGQAEYIFNEAKELRRELEDKRYHLNSLESAEIIDCHQQNKIIPAYNKLKQYLLTHFEKTEPDQFSTIDFKKILSLAEELENNLISINENLNETYPNAEEKDKEKINSCFHSLSYFRTPLENIVEFASDKKRIPINTLKTLFVNGEGGEGKTHLFADTTRERLNKGLTSILFIGEHLNQNENIVKQLINELGLNCTSEEFLGALDSKAQISGYRGIIAIDAINESENLNAWKKRIAGFINEVTKYPHLAVAISYRTIYQDTLFEEDYINKNKTITVEAPGFKENTERAICEIFKHFSIERPVIPNLMPKFYNPLFLITFCESLKRENLTKILGGINGLMDVFNFYLNSLNKEISNKLDLDPSDEIIQKCCYTIANNMAKNNDEYIKKSEIKKILKPYDNSLKHKKTLLFQFLSTGLMYKIKPYKAKEEEFKFTFQRFSDYIIVKSLLEKYLSPNTPIKSFYKNKPLGKIFRERVSPGWLEALAIILPAYSNKELEILDVFKKEMSDFITSRRILDSFKESLLWRNPKNITQKTLIYIVKNFGKKTIYEILINLSLKKDCKLNAYWLDNHLKKFTLIDNDIRWTQSIQGIYRYRNNIIDKIITWSWQTDMKCVEDETAKLYAIILAWFFTSADRKLRDCATRGLVNLFSSKLSIVPDILVNFKDVNDPYISERLYCSIYGAVLIKRNDLAEHSKIKKVIDQTYSLIFADDNPPVNILIRDYAKGIIEVGEVQNLLNESIELNKVKPPYRSSFPSHFKSLDSLKKIYKPYQDGTHPFLQKVYSSVVAGDFERYILQSKTSHIKKIITPKFQAENSWDKFILGLSKAKQKKSNKLSIHNLSYQLNPPTILIKQIMVDEEWGEVKREAISPPKIEKDNHAQSFYNSLSSKERVELDGILKKYSEEEQQKRGVLNQNCKFQAELHNKAIRWILKRILELCDYKSLPNEFDDATYGSYSRNEHKEERIGKKYQWIAMYEFLALALDKYKFCDTYWTNDDYIKYDCAGHFSVRNIDPTLTNKMLSSETVSIPFWITEKYNDNISIYDSKEKLKKWCKDCINIPEPKNLIEFNYNNSDFLNLNSFYDWKTQTDKETLGGDIVRFFYFLNSYIVKKEDMQKAIKIFSKNNIRNYRMPEEFQHMHLFSAEYPDSIVYKSNFKNYNNWSQVDELDFELKNTTGTIYAEYSYDYSLEGNTFSFYVPEKWLIEDMNLKHSGEDSVFVDKQKNIIFHDPGLSTTWGGKSALLANKDELLKFLDNNDYSIFWTVNGEKMISGCRLEFSGMFWYKNKVLEGNILPYDFLEF